MTTSELHTDFIQAFPGVNNAHNGRGIIFTPSAMRYPDDLVISQGLHPLDQNNSVLLALAPLARLACETEIEFQLPKFLLT